MDASRPRRGELLELGERRGSALARQLDESQEHLGRRLRVGKRPVARPDGHAEEVGERAEVRSLDAAPKEIPGERDRVDHGRGEPLAGHPFELAVHEPDVEPCVVGDQHGGAGERREPLDRRPHARRPPQRIVRQSGETAHSLRHGSLRRHEGLEGVGELEPPDPDGADLADPRRGVREPGRLEIEDHELGVGERRVGHRRERDERTAPGKPSVVLDERREQGARQPLRCLAHREQMPCRLARLHAASAFLDELDQPIERVDR